MKLLAATVLLLISGTPSSALAWGREGHRIVAEIAEQYLEPETARQVRELLALEHATTLAEVSTWADEIRDQRPETAPWHYVNIPIHLPAGMPLAYDAARDCPGGECVVAKIDQFAAVLREKATPPRQRLEALKFLVDLVADIHQPLHCADDGDRNGSDIHVIFLGQYTTLYALWDSGMLAAMGISDVHAYGLNIGQALAPALLAKWRSGSAADWATESYRLARLIYGGSYEARALQIFYQDDLVPALNLQLEKAGLRLATVLNDALK